jgi:hypothetical protein
MRNVYRILVSILEGKRQVREDLGVDERIILKLALIKSGM